MRVHFIDSNTALINLNLKKIDNGLQPSWKKQYFVRVMHVVRFLFFIFLFIFKPRTL